MTCALDFLPGLTAQVFTLPMVYSETLELTKGPSGWRKTSPVGHTLDGEVFHLHLGAEIQHLDKF